MQIATQREHIAGRSSADLLIRAGVVGPSIFLGMMLIAIASGRHSGSSAGSELELSSVGWLASAIFVAAGASIVAFAVGLWRRLTPASRVGTVLLGVAGAGVLLSGIFQTDARGTVATTHGSIHEALFPLTVLALTVSLCFNGVALRRAGLRGALAHSVIATVAAPLLVVLFATVSSDPRDPLYGVGALVQLALIATLFTWVVVNALRLSRPATSRP